MLESYYKDEEEKQFCEREVSKLICATSLVESVMSANGEYPHSEISEFNHHEVLNLFHAVNCYGCDTELDTNEDLDICPHCSSNDIESEFKEVLEWWIIDEWTARHLATLGKPILRACGLNFWGRTCSGQAIVLDGVFQDIYRRINNENKGSVQNE